MNYPLLNQKLEALNQWLTIYSLSNVYPNSLTEYQPGINQIFASEIILEPCQQILEKCKEHILSLETPQKQRFETFQIFL